MSSTGLPQSTISPLRGWSEILILFGVMPTLLLAPVPTIAIVTVVLVALAYSLYLLRRDGLLTKQQLFSLPEGRHWWPMLLRFGVFALLSTAVVYWWFPDLLFQVVWNHFGLWLMILFIYSVFSVFPQELVYRHFFMHRYSSLFPNTISLVAINALMFCFAHVVFANTLVFVLTLAGGILFALTYQRSQSLMFTSIEHSLYGLWLFTLGIGEMLAFPTGG